MRGQLLRDVLREAGHSLVQHRLRVGLSMLGISWGIVSVVVLLAYGEGLRRALDAGFRGAFSKATAVTFAGQTSLQVGGQRAGKRVRVRASDVGDVGRLPLVRHASPEYMEEVPVGYANQQAVQMVRGVAESYGSMRHEIPRAGRFLIDEDIRLRRRVAFLGSEVARKIFGSRPGVGETIRVKGVPYEVIGVGTEKVQMANYNRPDKHCVFVPWTTMSTFTDTTYVDDFVWQAASAEAAPRAERQVRELLAARYRFDPADERALDMFGSAQLDEIAGGIVTGLKIVLAFIGVLTLAIGGVGVMNIMFVTVQERTREIGVRKALGARRRDIVWQFLLEAMVITMAGGAVGIVCSFGLVWLLSPWPFLAELLDDTSRSTDIHLRLTPGLLVMTAGALTAVGFISGLLPAMKASKLDPIEALRYE